MLASTATASFLLSVDADANNRIFAHGFVTLLSEQTLPNFSI